MNDKGYTLLEVLVVISIIGFFVQTSVFGFNRYMEAVCLKECASKVAIYLFRSKDKAMGNSTIEGFSSIKNISITGLSDIRYSASGFPVIGGSGTVIIQNSFGKVKRVIVNSIGRIRIE